MENWHKTGIMREEFEHASNILTMELVVISYK